MAKGKSGRVVIEVDPDLKRRLYSELAREDLTLKDWFVDAASRYLSEIEQPTLPGVITRSSRGTQAL
jgi:hypothetical protein